MSKSSKIVVGFWRRFFADFLDAIFLGLPGFGIGYLFRYTFSSVGVHAIWFGLVCSFLYYGILHTRIGGGQTPGKRLLGIQVLRKNGDFLNFWKSFLRYLVISFVFYNGIYGGLLIYLPPKAMMAAGSIYFLVIIWTFFACFLLIPFHPLKRGLHDIVADSIVVYKGTFDDDALSKLDSYAKTKRTMIILTIGSIIFAGGGIMGLKNFTSGNSSALTKMTNIQRFLGDEYDVRKVSANRFNGKATSLAVVIFLPLESFDKKAVKEQVRKEVYNKIESNFDDLEQFGDLRVVITSGFNIGIANFNITD